MKKIVCLLFAAALLLTACGAPKPAPSAPPAAEAPAQPELAAETPAPADTPAPAVTDEMPAEPEEPADSVSEDPSDMTGYYTDDGYNIVRVGRNGDEYTMEISIYRLTTLDEGDVTVTDEGLLFHTIDAAGGPMTVLFYPAGDSTYSFLIVETYWPLLEQGTVFAGLIRTEDPLG